MRALYISSLVVTVLLFIVIGYFAEQYNSVDWDIFLDELYSDNSYGYDYNDYRYSELHNITLTGAVFSMLFIVFYMLTFSFTLKNIKRTTAKVISIIGLSISGIFFLSCLVPLSNPSHVAFDDEFAPAMIFYGLIMLAFCIVNLVQAVRNSSVTVSNQQVIDDIV